MLGGVNVISGTARLKDGSNTTFTAIPYFAAGNARPGSGYKVWIDAAE